MKLLRSKLVFSLTLAFLALTVSIADVSHLTLHAGPTTQASPVAGVYFDHVVVVIMEDHGIQEICGRSPPPCSTGAGAPYMAGLANSYAIGSQYLGVTHFSQGDYLALLGGTTDNCSSASCQWPFAGPNLVDRLEAAGLTWKGYMENQNLASGCDTSYHQPYTPEHNPFVGFSDIVNSPSRCSNIVLANPSNCSVTDCTLIKDLNSGSTPNFMWLSPDDCDNMHGYTYPNGAVLCPTSVSSGDAYLSGLIPNILGSVTFTSQRSALFVVFDEGNGYCPLNQSTTEDCVYAVWAGRVANENFATGRLYNHYSWTRTVELNWNLASLTSNDANATPMTEFFMTPLSASFTYTPTSPKAGEQIAFTAEGSGGTAPYRFNWSFGDGSTATGSSATHSYSTGGNFTVTLTAKDNSTSQQTATSQQTLTVSAPTPALAASFSYAPTSPQVGQVVSFTGSASGGTGPYTYAWSFGDGSTATGPTTTHSYSTSGSYSVSLTVKDSSSPQQTATSQKTVSVTSPPPFSASFTFTPSTPQTGQQITFTASATGGTSPYGYNWNFGDGSSGTGSSVAHAYSAAGSYTVILTVTDSSLQRQEATSQQTVSVASSSSAISASFGWSPSSPQPGQQITFTGSVSGGTSPYSFTWNFGDGSAGTGPSVTHTYTSAGTYTVILTVKDGGAPQQTTTSQKTVSVTSPPPPLSASFKPSPSSPDSGQSISFTASATGGTSPYTYSWSFGDGGTASGTSANHVYQSSGSYTVSLTIIDSAGKTASSTQTISVNPQLSASFTYGPSNPLPLTSVTFAASASGGSQSYSYSWDFGDGSTGSGQSASHSYLLPGTYTVALTVTDTNGQSITTSQTITVLTSLV